MPKFSYTAVDARGKQANGFVEANDQNDAITQIRQLGFYPQRLDEAKEEEEEAVSAEGKPAAKKKRGAKVKSKILTIFTRQLATLIEAGLPLMRSLNTLAKQERNPVMRATMAQLAAAVESGGTFSEALAQHPRIFDKLYVNMVKAGELGGVLEIVLNRLAEFQEKSQKIKGKVMAAMIYPVVVLVIAAVILSFLLVFIVPKFQQIFHGRPSGQAASRSHLVRDRVQRSLGLEVVSCGRRDRACGLWLQNLGEHACGNCLPGPDCVEDSGFWGFELQNGHFPLCTHLGNLDQQRRAHSPGVEYYP